LIAVILAQGTVPRRFTHAGSDTLDEILAYDRAEAGSAYAGQVNMITVSSFLGPEGLLWGYDVAKVELPPPEFLTAGDLVEFAGVKVRSGEGLRRAAQVLFGSVTDQRFPFLPGAHVACAGRHRCYAGPTAIYSSIAIGVPEERATSACLFMEDVGQLDWVEDEARHRASRRRLLLDIVRSVVEIGKNQHIRYREIIADVTVSTVAAGEVGCALVAAPYFKLAGRAHDAARVGEPLDCWLTRLGRSRGGGGT
jgi:histidine decarboxylase